MGPRSRVTFLLAFSRAQTAKASPGPGVSGLAEGGRAAVVPDTWATRPATTAQPCHCGTGAAADAHGGERGRVPAELRCGRRTRILCTSHVSQIFSSNQLNM